jgi:tetratricopeptide (TPR) repeat protein
MNAWVAGVLTAIVALGDGEKTAAEWNELGVEQLKAKHYDDAIQLLQRATRADPAHRTIRENLGVAYHNRGVSRLEARWVAEAIADFERALDLRDDVTTRRHLARGWMELRDFGRAEAVLIEARAEFPDEPTVHRDLGFLYYAKDDLPRAIESLKRRLELGEEAVVTALLERCERENSVSSDYVDRSSNDFTLKFLGKPEDFAVADQVLSLLQDARAKVGSELGAFPRDKTTVLLYSRQDFQKATATHGWVGGLYDGKIRLPIDDFARERESIRRTATHEYAHRVIADLAPLCPLWLNEGLAEFFEGVDPHAGVRALVAKGTKPAAFAELPAEWVSETDVDKVRLWYAQSRSFVGFFHGRYGVGAVRAVLSDLGRGDTLDQAFVRSTGQDVQQLDALWRSEILAR